MIEGKINFSLNLKLDIEYKCIKIILIHFFKFFNIWYNLSYYLIISRTSISNCFLSCKNRTNNIIMLNHKKNIFDAIVTLGYDFN